MGTSGTGLWTDGGNWDLGHAPGILDVACIKSGTTTPVVLKGGGDPVKIAGLEISGMGHSLTIDSTNSLTISGMYGPSVVSSITVGGSLTNASPSVLELTGVGTVSTGSGSLTPGVVTNFGTLQLDASMCVMWGASIHNSGKMLLASDDPIWTCGTPSGTLSNAYGATITKILSSGGASSIDVLFNNSGTVTSIAGKLKIGSGTDSSADYAASAGGSVEFTSGSTRTFADGPNRIDGTGVILNGALLKGFDSDDTLSVIGTLTWLSGSFGGPGAVFVEGVLKVIAPGPLTATLPVTNTGLFSLVSGSVSVSGALNDPGKLSICPLCSLGAASVSLSKSSVTTIEVASTGVGRLASSGIATLGGSLDAVNMSGFKPAKGKSFGFLAAKSVSGSFANRASNGYTLGYSRTSASLVAM
jgi:hypothetical protein